ncbi:hypothetical protein [Dethiobacter alkaliphilus]|uniref:hypothetical protein n=1 Tax=Dethiobacter alkaliphilus TaxID=427926 RepID=UPI0022271415|nr:hypothetical protein [Dethiobacter alkaliphilus]MCW3488846.1 hypothetical protein [Dethiobacter alkaliphilus]
MLYLPFCTNEPEQQKRFSPGLIIFIAVLLVVGGSVLYFYPSGKEPITEGSDVPNVVWEKKIGGDTNDAGYAVCKAQNGGYIIVGSKEQQSGEKKDIWIINTDYNGEVQWEKTFGGSGNAVAYFVQQADDGYIITGCTEEGNDKSLYLLKVDLHGNLEWEKTFGSGVGYCVGTDLDGGFIVAGWTESLNSGKQAASILKVDAEGSLVWEYVFEELNSSGRFNSLHHSDDGWFVAVGVMESGSNNRTDMLLIKVDSEGKVKWEKIISPGTYSSANSVASTADGGMIVAGEILSEHDKVLDIYLLKLDAFNNIQWEKSFGFTGNSWANSVLAVKDGGYMVLGEVGSGDDFRVNTLLMKVDMFGEKEWELLMGDSSYTGGYSLASADDGSYVIVGTASGFAQNTDLYLVRVK